MLPVKVSVAVPEPEIIIPVVPTSAVRASPVLALVIFTVSLLKLVLSASVKLASMSVASTAPPPVPNEKVYPVPASSPLRSITGELLVLPGVVERVVVAVSVTVVVLSP